MSGNDWLNDYPVADKAAAPAANNDWLNEFPAEKAAAPPAAAPKKGKSLGRSALDSLTALTSGINRGALAGLPGIPMDTLANVVDMGKAAVGVGYGALTGNAPPAALDPMDRSGIPLTSDWLMKKYQNSAIAPAFNPSDPADEGGYLQTIGTALPGAMNVPQAIQSAIGATAGKAAYDATGLEAARVLGTLAPAAARQGLSAAGKYAVRGGEDGRQELQRRVETLRAAGIDEPTVGLATGNRLIGGIENVLRDTPGAIGVMEANRAKAMGGLEGTTARGADLASAERGALVAGQGIQSGLAAFVDKFKDRQDGLYDKLAQQIGPETQIPVNSTQNALARLTSTTPGAEALTEGLVNREIARTAKNFNADAARIQPTMYGTQALTPELPFGGVKKVRSDVGSNISNELLSGAPAAQWKALYAGLSEDMKGGAALSGPAATQAFNRANKYTSAVQGDGGRMEKVAPFTSQSKLAPEDSFNSLVRTLASKGSTFDAVKKSLPDSARGKIAGTVIEDLGKSIDSKQNANGSNWSSETFLTNWNKLTPEGQKKLFSGFKDSEKVSAAVGSVAEAAALMRGNGLWNNPSGTAASSQARDFVRKFATPISAAAAAGGALISPMAVAAVPAGLAATNMLARGLTSQSTIKALSRKNGISEDQATNLLRTLYLTNPEDYSNTR